MKIISAAELLDTSYKDPLDIVAGGVLGYQAFTLITGQEGIGKSLLVMQLATHIARGQPWLGFDVPHALPVLLVQKELPNTELQTRLRTQLSNDPAPPGMYIVEDPWDLYLDSQGNETVLDEAIRGIKPRVIILDPLMELHAINENSNSEVAQVVVRPVRRWMGWGCSVVIVHHHSKPNEEFPRQGTSRVRGASALSGAADCNLQLTETNREAGWFQLEFAKLRRYAPQRAIAITRDPKTATYHLRGAHLALFHFLQMQGGQALQSDATRWAMATLHTSERNAYAAVTRLVDEGKIVRLPGPPGASPYGGRPAAILKVVSKEGDVS